jgi:hypothetical protein
MPRPFRVGDIITGLPDNGYSKTTDEALMLVKRKYGDYIDVVILCNDDDYHSSLGHTYDVWNDESIFRHITFEEYYEDHPDCRKMDEDKIAELLEEYPKSKKREVKPYVLSDEMRKELIEEMKGLLLEYDYHPTEEALNKILDEWCKNKGDLIRLFEKHPNYNGKFQIAFDYDYARVIDYDAIYRFRSWLREEKVLNLFKKEVQLGAYSYKELVEIVQRLSYFKDIFSDYGYAITIREVNGKTEEEYEKEYRHFKELKRIYEFCPDIVIEYSRTYDKTLYQGTYKIDKICRALNSTDNMSQFVNDCMEHYFSEKFPEAKIKEGQKMSRAIGKILRMLGVNKLEDYNAEFAKFSDAVNPLKIKRHTIISIHPIDYLTMSFGNSWSSCQTIDKGNKRGIDGDHQWGGMSSSGTMSYMLDSTSCIFYTVDKKYNGNQYELQDKINRCMFHYYDNRLVQGRVYPQSNDNGANDLYKDIREIVQKVFADMLEIPNYWTNKSGVGNCCDAIDSYGTHYRDYENFDNCNVSTLKDGRKGHELIEIGHDPICPCCGNVHSRNKNIECTDCNRRD